MLEGLHGGSLAEEVVHGCWERVLGDPRVTALCFSSLGETVCMFLKAEQ